MSEIPRQFGPYTLLKLLAKGGMGEIFLARTAGLSHFEKYYAVKKLLKKFTKDKDVGARFVDEAKLGARLQHPNIVQVYDLGKIGEELYMATEFVDGFDLRRVLRFCHEKKKRIPLDIALFIVREVLSGLSYAHRQLDAEGKSINLIHRDISPQNVLVSFEGEVKIIDFGLAKSTQRSQETQANVLLGNFGYMSPEQARGHKLDVRTDVYSSGVVLFELVTRTKRFVDENPLRLLEMVARPTPVLPSDRVSDVPRKVDDIYAKATAPNKDDRYQSADDFRKEVNAALHRLNSQASRENLSQFLNHLFLGGKPPPDPDSDLLDKSVAIQVQDLHAHAEAFRRTKEQDAQDRRLSHFDDNAPQTGSHNLMRSCRVGDTLTHAELTGDALEERTDPKKPETAAAPAAQIEAPPIAWDNQALVDPQAAETHVYDSPPVFQAGGGGGEEDPFAPPQRATLPLENITPAAMPDPDAAALASIPVTDPEQLTPPVTAPPAATIKTAAAPPPPVSAAPKSGGSARALALDALPIPPTAPPPKKGAGRSTVDPHAETGEHLPPPKPKKTVDDDPYARTKDRAAPTSEASFRPEDSGPISDGEATEVFAPAPGPMAPRDDPSTVRVRPVPASSGGVVMSEIGSAPPTEAVAAAPSVVVDAGLGAEMQDGGVFSDRAMNAESLIIDFDGSDLSDSADGAPEMTERMPPAGGPSTDPSGGGADAEAGAEPYIRPAARPKVPTVKRRVVKDIKR